MRIAPLAAAVEIGAFLLLASVAMVEAAEVKVLSTPTLKTVLDDLGPQMERDTGHRLVIRFDSAAALKRQIEAGDPFDVTILLPPLIDDLIKQGKIAEGTRADIARTGAGVAIRAGAPKPDVSSVAALKQVLLNAKSISYAEDSASGRYFAGLLERLGIAAEVRPRLKAVPGGGVVEAVAKGEAELTVITIPNIVGVPGVEVAGLLPAELQNYTVFTAGVGADARDREAARSLIKFLLAPEATPMFAAKGMERASPP